MSQREYDLCLFGSTGFVGRLTAHYLAASAPTGTRIALGGRSRTKLESLQSELGAPACSWALVVADSFDQAALQGLARSATTVATSVGPYARYGRHLVAACAEAGTHYADLTGEVLFVRETVESLNDLASRSGARIVHSCGYDSVPSDLGVLLLHEKAASEGAGELTETVLKASMKGGLSGGTIDSARNQIDTIRHDSRLRAVLADPYALSPQRDAEPSLDDEPDVFYPEAGPAAGRVGSPVPHGFVQHQDREAEQRPERLGLRAVLPLPGGDGLRAQPGGGGHGRRGHRRCRRHGGGYGLPAGPPGAGPGTAGPR